MRRIINATFSHNRSSIDWWFVARCSLGVAISLLAGFAAGSSLYALAAGMGAMSTGFASLRGVYRTRAAAMLGTAFGMALCAYIAGIAGQSSLAILAVVAVAAYVFGVLSSLGESAAGIGLNSLIALVILGSLPMHGWQIAIVAALVLGGGLVQTLLVVALWPVGRHAVERQALRTAYRELAAYSREIGVQECALPASGTLANVRATLADPQPFGRRGDLIALQTLSDDAERIRASLATLATDPNSHDRVLADATADLLDAIACALDEARSPRDEGHTWERANAVLATHPQWQRLFGQIRAAWRSASEPAPVRGRTAIVDPLLVPHVDRWWATVRGNLSLSSPFGRHAVRTSVTLAIAIALYRFAHVERGYWIALTALLVLRPDFTTTFTRGLGRIAGTIAGAVLASAIALVVPHTPQVDIALAIVFATLGYLAFSVNYALYSLTITAYVIFILSFIGLPEHAAVVDRIVATLLGGALATLAYVIWPTWESPLTHEQLADLLEFSRAYAQTTLEGYIDPARIDMARMRRLQGMAWRSRARAEASVERMLNEPQRTHERSANQTLTVLASSARFSMGNLVLRSRLSEAAKTPRPALRPFAQSLDVAMRAVIAALREGHPPQAYPSLRDALINASSGLRASDAASADVILAQCDLFVDSINTMAETLA